MDTGALNDGVGAGKIDILEHTDVVGRRAAVGADGAHTGIIHHNNLAGQHIPHKAGAHGVQRTALGGKGPAGTVGQLADAQRAEPVGIAGRDELGVGHNH